MKFSKTFLFRIFHFSDLEIFETITFRLDFMKTFFLIYKGLQVSNQSMYLHPECIQLAFYVILSLGRHLRL